MQEHPGNGGPASAYPFNDGGKVFCDDTEQPTMRATADEISPG